MAKAWVIRRVSDGLYVQRGMPERFGPLETAGVFANENRGRGSACKEWVELADAGQPVEAKPAIAQPSPYSEDEPIPYRLTDTDERDNLIARIAVQYERAARHVRKAARLEKRLAKVAP